MAAKGKSTKGKAQRSTRQGCKAILFNLDEGTPRGDAIRAALSSCSISVRTVTSKQLADPVGSIAGLVGFRPSLKPFEGSFKPCFDEPFILFCDLPHATFNEALDALRETGVNIPHKAILTKYNKSWPLAGLIEAVSQEYASVTAQARAKESASDDVDATGDCVQSGEPIMNDDSVRSASRDASGE